MSDDVRDETLAAIRTLTSHHGYAPTVRELAAYCGLASPASMAERLQRLRGQGLVDWEDGQARTVRTVGGPCDRCGQAPLDDVPF